MNQPVDVFFFNNGNSAIFDSAGQQITELQEPWLLLFVAHLESKGVDPAQIKFLMPDGKHAKLLRTSDNRWNWATK